VAEFGIDLGTANTVVCDVARGIVLDVPSVMLLRRVRGGRARVVAVGREAADMLGRTPEGLTTLRPLQDGVLTDLETGRAYLREVVRAVGMLPWQRGRRVVIGVPTGATSLERRALLEAADEAGISRATALDEPIAGALGCGLDPLDRRVHMVVDAGGGTAEVTAFCFGGIVATRSTRVSGDEMTTAVQQHLREHHRLVVDEGTAETVKIRCGVDDEPGIVVQGRDAATGRARLATVPVAEIADVLRPVTGSIVDSLAGCLDDLSPQALSDVLADGVLAFGGASLTPGLVEGVEHRFGLPVKRAENPLTCVAEGAARSLQVPGVLAAYGHA
jgi:rod shape-determining protein MreB and related proteins